MMISATCKIFFRYVLQFHRETESELRERKEQARHSLQKVSEQGLEVNSDDYFPEELNFPKRPKWNYQLSKEVLEQNEQRYFTVSSMQTYNTLFEDNTMFNFRSTSMKSRSDFHGKI